MALTKDKRNLFMIVASIMAFIALFQVMSYFKVASSMEKEGVDPHRKIKVLSESQSQALLHPDKGRQHKGLPDRKNANPRVYFDISIDERPAGKVVFELYADRVPKTAENFRALASGTWTTASGEKLSYKGSKFHRIFPGFICQGGDLDGQGGQSIYGPTFDDEPSGLKLKHDRKGLLSMANSGPNSNGSQFSILMDAAPHLDGKFVIFGEVISGMDVVEEMNSYGRQDGVAAVSIVVTSCGEITA
ncbi:cyclophilin-like peptidyl-prolyl cis-trans isomerase family protein [Klebsormidium nitens]|uniref:Peptidyl-prolyl cis-trans isomerase n=1 Tax=Klebsormidium nitens TaxID=105231 RepID=A0A1Y1HKU1_KLENI|nr:cyclophilin-like peptidyl-prolyl cis-trans isomerase family protein [Klebsormidium nitens]|eukprot:GAQ77749.1 cyclophilin-like peptidyl-prolyl cis-trans isomerase family protein [Klebsormidium nitens]